MIGLKNVLGHNIPSVQLTININSSPLPLMKQAFIKFKKVDSIQKKQNSDLANKLSEKLKNINNTEHPGGV